jgi:hypothetical protein
MNPWGGIPLIAAALLSGGASGPAVAGHQGVAIPSAVPSPSISLPAGAPTPVLQQIGRTWETTVLLSSISPACGQLSGVDYWLATTTPNKVIQGHATPPTSSAYTDPKAPFGSTCQVLVTFMGLTQVPATATLVIDQAGTSSTVTLTVHRNVTLNDYLVIPAIMGGSVTILSLVLSVLLVWIYDRKRKKPRPRIWDWLTRPIIGSGAWTANDSWATNVSTGLVVVSAVLAATSAANSLFPGVALDRFTIVNLMAGFFVAAAPVVFGILYSWLTALRPGPIADATVRLPVLRPATISVPSGASITLAADTAIQDGSTQWARVRGGGSYQIAPGATIKVVAGVQAIARPCCEAAMVAVYTNDAAGPRPAARVGVQAARHGTGQAHDEGVKAGWEALRLAIEQAVTELGSPDGDLPPRKTITSAIEGNGVRDAVADVLRATAGAAGSKVTPTVSKGDIRRIIKAMQRAVPNSDDLPAVYNAMAVSGTADIGVLPCSTLQIDKWAGTLTIQASDVVAQKSSPPAPPEPPELPVPLAPDVQFVQLVPAKKDPPDAPLDQPVFISAVGGAKVTVTGSADIALPKDTQISAPQAPFNELRRPGRLLVPQGTNVIVANLIIILIVNFLTMFGIGAELGIASVLADFSDATGHGHVWIFIGLATVAFLVVVYAATATRTMADPQPGSSISSQVGASFTL